MRLPIDDALHPVRWIHGFLQIPRSSGRRARFGSAGEGSSGGIGGIVRTLRQGNGRGSPLNSQSQHREAIMADVTITPLDNGPYLVRGPVKIIDADGTTFEVKKETVALCRCGGSTTKPFC